MVAQAEPGQCPELMPPDVLASIVLPPTQVDVWLVPAVADDAAVEKVAGHWLSDEERVRLNGRRLPKGRAMFLLTRAVLRRLLSAYCPDVHPKDWQLGRSAEGRPCVLGPVSAPFFNLSHTDDALVLAFASHGEPGVDIEQMGRQLDAGALAQRYFSATESQSLLSLPATQQRDRFLRLWTLKEACVKANGQGLAQALRHFEFAFADSGRLMFYPTPLESPPNCYWRLWSITLSDLRIALAVRCQTDPGKCQYRLRQLQWPDRVIAITREADYSGSL